MKTYQGITKTSVQKQACATSACVYHGRATMDVNGRPTLDLKGVSTIRPPKAHIT